MRLARLEMALENGAVVVPPAGDIVVWRPRTGDDLSVLPRERVVVRTGFKPDYDYFKAQGYRMESDAKAGLAVVCLPRAKREARALLAQSAAGLADGGLIVVDGQKTDGVDTILKDCRALGLHVGEALGKAHGRLAVVTPGPALAE